MSPEEVTPAMRSAAKAVNFGIVYGISDFTLARNLHISRAESPGLYRSLFRPLSRGKGVSWTTAVSARGKSAMPEPLGGGAICRKFTVPISTSAPLASGCAMNSPIQGTAADIIKLAMVRVHDAFRREGLSARLVLQVHDELMVEAPEAEVPRVQELLRECMENVITLAVPLKTDLSVGRNWLACK